MGSPINVFLLGTACVPQHANNRNFVRDCCERAASGHAAAAPPMMNCRRFMASSRLRLKAYHSFGQPGVPLTNQFKPAAMGDRISCFFSKLLLAPSFVRRVFFWAFTPLGSSAVPSCAATASKGRSATATRCTVPTPTPISLATLITPLPARNCSVMRCSIFSLCGDGPTSCQPLRRA
jgi:hypothetical protein